MSRTYKTIKYKCFNDCKQSGCDGHILEVCFDNSADVVSVSKDGDLHDVYDQNFLKALVKVLTEAGYNE